VNKKAILLRELFKTKPVLKIMGAHNGLGAKLIERNGFDGIWASGLEISTTHAVPDANILTMTENLDAARAINDAGSLPVICDCDTGYGNVANVMHMVKKYESAGLAAVVIEDKRFPKVNSFVPGRQELAPIDEFMGKIQGAVSVRQSDDFMIFARVEALIAGWGLEEALQRAKAYEEAGADGIVIHSKSKTPDEIFEFARRWKGRTPLVAIPTTYFDVPAKELGERGFRMIIYANHGLRACIRAMDETFTSIINSGSTADVEGRIASMKEVFEIQGMVALKEDEKRFHKTERLNVLIPAAGDHRSQADFGALLEDKPLCMLKISDKTILQYQTELFRSAGATDIYVVGGYQVEKINVDGATIIKNDMYASSHVAYSIMAAREQIQRGKSILCYSDILFDKQILSQLMSSPYPITLVIDRAFKTLPFRQKTLDLVVAEDPALGSNDRRMNLNSFKPVKAIGKKIKREEATCEFVGLALFQGEGFNLLCKAWDDAHPAFQNKSFYEASSVLKASFTDIIQFMIDSGIPIYGLEVEHGWSEIHSIDDYRRLQEYFDSSEVKNPVGLAAK